MVLISKINKVNQTVNNVLVSNFMNTIFVIILLESVKKVNIIHYWVVNYVLILQVHYLKTVDLKIVSFVQKELFGKIIYAKNVKKVIIKIKLDKQYVFLVQLELIQIFWVKNSV